MRNCPFAEPPGTKGLAEWERGEGWARPLCGRINCEDDECDEKEAEEEEEEEEDVNRVFE